MHTNLLPTTTTTTTLLFMVLFVNNGVRGKTDFSEIFKNIKADTTATVQANAAIGVISRALPVQWADQFNVEIDFDLPRNTYKIFKNDSSDTVWITASAGVAACKAFYHYLKYYCNCHVSWEGSQFTMPDQLPSVNVTDTSASSFIYYQNVCTWSYSFAWWKWEDWQKHLDWMALNGITLTLAPVQELIWSAVYEELGLTKDEIDDHFTGPAFMAWQRMGNMRGWGGPLTFNFKKSSSNLQRRVIQFLRDLGIAVALPAFAGHVPVAFSRLFPNSTLTPAQRWNRFPDQYCCPLFIDPVDPLFEKIGQLFLKKIIAEYGGTNHIYFSDPFNEMQPRLADSKYLSDASRGIYETMRAVDSDAVWLLQGWMFVKNPFWSDDLLKAFLTAVPIGRILVLDLQSEIYPQYERTHSFYGQPFIWCMLHNFGGTLGMHGSLQVVNTRITEAKKMENSTMSGVGITPEGINQNYVMYEFALERAWDQEPVIVEKWFDHYALARYGKENKFVQQAWTKLRNSVYSYDGSEAIRGKYIVCRRPSFKLSPSIWYNETIITQAWSDLLSASTDFRNSHLFKHDLVDVTRQYLQNIIEQLYVQLLDAFQRKDKDIFIEKSALFAEALIDMEKILNTSTDFLLGKWLEQAKSLATSSAESQLFEINALNQITTWGPTGQIVDYAMKQWAGIVSDYCLPRWKLFFEMCLQSLWDNQNFNAKRFRVKVFKDVEEPFTVSHKKYAVDAIGDTIETSRKLYVKWNVIGVEPAAEEF